MQELYGGRPLPPFPNFVSVSGGDTATPLASEEAPHKAEPSSQGAATQGLAATKYRPAAERSRPLGLLSGLNLSGLMANPDNLLIIGLILVLLADGADEKLILALVFIML